MHNGCASRQKEAAPFELTGEDGKFVQAVATIAGDSIVVTSDEAKAPLAIPPPRLGAVSIAESHEPGGASHWEARPVQ